MKTRNLVIYLVIAVLLGGVVLMNFRADAADKDSKALALTFPGLDAKKPVKLEDYRGKVVVLDVWATWCGYCVREIPEMIAFNKEMIAKKQPVQFIGISVDDDKDAVRNFVKKQKIDYPIGYGDNKLLKPFGSIPGIPMKFIINKDGVVVDKIIGATDTETIKKKIEALVKEK